MGMQALVHNVLQGIGINPERFSLQWASAAEAPRFVKLITEFTGRIKVLGPLGGSEGIDPDELKLRLAKGMAAVSSKKVRMVYGNTAKSIRKDNIFTQEYINGVIEEKLGKAIAGALSAEAEKEGDEPAAEKMTGKDKPFSEVKKETVREKIPPKQPTGPKKSVAKKATTRKKSATKKKK